ncbi:hypothetical protein [Amycolatopsis thermoflava]|uniref:hypothetical protein n=1 Tax=Amycolatopsis thermoflava TaxID=84480 RepID=UPI0012FB325F|nr:hypothetical protein [Amycolatopsis thermoflava]
MPLPRQGSGDAAAAPGMVMPVRRQGSSDAAAAAGIVMPVRRQGSSDAAAAAGLGDAAAKRVGSVLGRVDAKRRGW